MDLKADGIGLSGSIDNTPRLTTRRGAELQKARSQNTVKALLVIVVGGEFDADRIRYGTIIEQPTLDGVADRSTRMP